MHYNLNELVVVEKTISKFSQLKYQTLFKTQDGIFNEEEFWYIADEVILMCTSCTDSDMVWTVGLIKGDVMVPD